MLCTGCKQQESGRRSFPTPALTTSQTGRTLRLSKCLDATVFSFQVGARKPDPRIYQHATRGNRRSRR
jgi:beta-phosphoglucomutase-like phosphatase (HAD superfamily)